MTRRLRASDRVLWRLHLGLGSAEIVMMMTTMKRAADAAAVNGGGWQQQSWLLPVEKDDV